MAEMVFAGTLKRGCVTGTGGRPNLASECKKKGEGSLIQDSRKGEVGVEIILGV